MFEKQGRAIQIIVVDDEPISADDMSDVIECEFKNKYNVSVRTAYNAKQVFRLIEQTPCDILISDIQMPGMTGLDMVKKIRETDKQMQVLFLSGFDDFYFAHEAFRQNAVQYILKTEGDQTVLNAVEEQILRFRDNEKIQDRILEAESRYTQMIPAYRKQLFIELIMNQRTTLDEVEELMLAGELYLVFGKLQGNREHQVKTKMIAASAVSQIVSNSFGNELSWTENYLMDDIIIWVFCFQTEQTLSKTLFNLIRKSREQLEGQLHSSMFFVVSEESIHTKELSDKYVEIRTMLNSEILQGSSGVAIRQSNNNLIDPEQAKKLAEIRKNIENTQLLIHSGSILDAKKDVGLIIKFLDSHPLGSNLLAAEASSALNAAFLSYINRNGMVSIVLEAQKAGPMGSSDYFRSLIKLIEEEAVKRIDCATRSIAKEVVNYINNHISEDVSSTVLTEVTGYSSGYLSRVFRQEMNMSIHDYVSSARINLAKEMLCNTKLKIYEIAENCGYENTTYFTKIFKMNTGMTPQDYKSKRSVT